MFLLPKKNKMRTLSWGIIILLMKIIRMFTKDNKKNMQPMVISTSL